MKKILLILIFGAGFIWGYSQKYSLEVIFTLPQSDMYVKMEEFSGVTDHDTAVNVYCRVRCSDWKLTKIAEIFTEFTYNPDLVLAEGDTLYQRIFPDAKGRTIDSIFQHLYNWIKEIDNFAANSSVGDNILMNYHNEYCCSSLSQYDYYLEVHPNYITISTSIYMRDMEEFFCVRRTKMKLKTITEFKKRLLDYTSSHNISIKI